MSYEATVDLVELVIGVPRQAPQQARDVARDDFSLDAVREGWAVLVQGGDEEGEV